MLAFCCTFLAERKKSATVGAANVVSHQPNSTAVQNPDMAAMLLSSAVDGSTGSLPQYVTLEAASKYNVPMLEVIIRSNRTLVYCEIIASTVINKVNLLKVSKVLCFLLINRFVATAFHCTVCNYEQVYLSNM